MTDPTSHAQAPTPIPPPAGAPESGAAAADAALESARQAVEALSAEAGAGTTVRDEAMPVPLPDLSPAEGPKPKSDIALLAGVNLNVKIELGRTRLLVEDVLRLGVGSVVELDKLAGDPVDVYVNDRHIARGEVLVLNDNFCVRISEILAPPGQPRTPHPASKQEASARQPTTPPAAAAAAA